MSEFYVFMGGVALGIALSAFAFAALIFWKVRQ